MNTSASEFSSTSPFSSLISGLRAQGWRVIVPAITGDGANQATFLQGEFNSDPTGANDLSSILSQYDAWIAADDAEVGSLPTVVGGISWGGLYALQIANNRTLHGFFAHLPAAQPNALTEFSGYSLSTLGAFTPANMHDGGWISWALDDTRVGYTVAKQLASDIGATCTGKEYAAPHGHATTSSDVSDMLAFTAGL